LARLHSNLWMLMAFHLPSKRNFPHLPNQCQTSKNVHYQDLCVCLCQKNFVIKKKILL
jgi:hypothetical protein